MGGRMMSLGHEVIEIPELEELLRLEDRSESRFLIHRLPLKRFCAEGIVTYAGDQVWRRQVYHTDPEVAKARLIQFIKTDLVRYAIATMHETLPARGNRWR